MAALKVDCITWIITVLGAINSNHSFIFDLNYLLWKLKTSKRQVVSFLLETKHKVFRFKTKPIPRMPVQDVKRSLKILAPTLNFHFLRALRGSPPSFEKAKKDIFAMIRQLGPVTLFCSFSPAEAQWILWYISLEYLASLLMIKIIQIMNWRIWTRKESVG